MVARRAVNDSRQASIKNPHIFRAVDYEKHRETRREASDDQTQVLNKTMESDNVEGQVSSGLPIPTEDQITVVERLWKVRLYLAVGLIIIGWLFYAAQPKS